MTRRLNNTSKGSSSKKVSTRDKENRVCENPHKMPSSKGEPDNPKLREEVKEEVKNLEKGGGKGSWSAWKAMELSKRYEAKGWWL